MRAKTFDPKCWELACHFLADCPGATDEDRVQLASDLQDTAEDAIAEFDCCRACGACPGFIGAECDETCEWAVTWAAADLATSEQPK